MGVTDVHCCKAKMSTNSIFTGACGPLSVGDGAFTVHLPVEQAHAVRSNIKKHSHNALILLFADRDGPAIKKEKNSLQS